MERLNRSRNYDRFPFASVLLASHGCARKVKSCGCADTIPPRRPPAGYPVNSRHSIAPDERAQSAPALRSLYRLVVVCGIMIPHRWRGRRSLKFMPKRGIDADSRIFFDELVSIAASRLKATGAIRLEDRQVLIPFGEQNKLIGVAHTKFPNGGSWCYFRLPEMRRQKKKAVARRRCATLQALPRKARRALSLGLRLRPDRASERARSPRRQGAGHARRRPDALQACAAKLGQPTPR